MAAMHGGKDGDGDAVMVDGGQDWTGWTGGERVMQTHGHDVPWLRAPRIAPKPPGGALHPLLVGGRASPAAGGGAFGKAAGAPSSAVGS